MEKIKELQKRYLKEVEKLKKELRNKIRKTKTANRIANTYNNKCIYIITK